MSCKPRFRVYFSKGQGAAALRDYGEDDVADRAAGMSDEDLGRIQNIAARFEDPSYPLPVEGQRITHDHVTALAAITFFDGQVRPLSQSRRRPEKNRPERFTPTPLAQTPGCLLETLSDDLTGHPSASEELPERVTWVEF